jgi:hypothetical protein
MSSFNISMPKCLRPHLHTTYLLLLLLEHYSPLWTLASNTILTQLYRLLNRFVLTGLGCQPNAQPPTWRTRVSPLVWNFTLDLSGLGDPASSYATAGIALEIIGARKPHRHDKAQTPLVSLNTHLNFFFILFFLCSFIYSFFLFFAFIFFFTSSFIDLFIFCQLLKKYSASWSEIVICFLVFSTISQPFVLSRVKWIIIGVVYQNCRGLFQDFPACVWFVARWRFESRISQIS